MAGSWWRRKNPRPKTLIPAADGIILNRRKIYEHLYNSPFLSPRALRSASGISYHNSMSLQSNHLLDFLLLGCLALIWSTSFFLIKIGVSSLGPFTLTSIRLIIAATTLLVILRTMGRRLIIDRSSVQLYLFVGVMGNAVPFSLISLGEVQVTSSMAAVLMGIMPIATCVLAHLLIPSERMTVRKLLGVFLGFSGLITLVGISALGPVGGQPLGQLAVLGGALCYALTAVFVRLRGTIGNIEAAAGAGLVAALTSVVFAFVLENPTEMIPTVPALWSAVVLGLVHTALAALIYFRTIRNLDAVTFAQINYLIPVLGSIWGILLLGETFGLPVILALCLVLAGIYFVQPRRRLQTASRSTD